VSFECLPCTIVLRRLSLVGRVLWTESLVSKAFDGRSRWDALVVKTVLPGHSGIVDHNTKNQNSSEALVWCSYEACQDVVKNGRDLRDGKVIEAG
jgi:hypothetical protein